MDALATRTSGSEDIYSKVTRVYGDINTFLDLGQCFEQCEGRVSGVVRIKG